MSIYDDDQLDKIISSYCANDSELEHVEFKENFANPEGIGEYISSLSNSASLEGEPFGFLIWGVHDGDHARVGTSFNPSMKGKGNEDLVPWLTRLLTPEVHFEFRSLVRDEVRLVVLVVAAASHQPVMFMGESYIRAGTVQKKLKNLPDHARRLWAKFDETPFERRIARDQQDEDAVFRLLDYEAYFQLTDRPIPASRDEMLDAMSSEGIIRPGPAGDWRITNLGAILFAKDLSVFPVLGRKAPRVVSYDGRDKSAPAREQLGERGYAAGFRGLIRYVGERVPAQEVFDSGVRVAVPILPEKAVRELVANALIHQDFSLSGTGPMVEIFSDRVEVTNSGVPLVLPDRLIDAAPRSRNEAIASLMRRMGICEERGSGWDQIAALVEEAELPAPLVEVGADYMRVTLFSHRAFKDLSAAERLSAVYFHACLQHVRRSRTTNASLRARFRVADKNKAAISRLIRDAVDSGVIVAYDDLVGARAMSYVPHWAK